MDDHISVQHRPMDNLYWIADSIPACNGVFRHVSNTHNFTSLAFPGRGVAVVKG